MKVPVLVIAAVIINYCQYWGIQVLDMVIKIYQVTNTAHFFDT